MVTASAELLTQPKAPLISRLDIENYRAFKRLSVTFEDRFTVLTGVNGVGKTSLLKALFDAGIGYTNMAFTSPWQGTDEATMAHLTSLAHGGARTFSANYPVSIEASTRYFGDEFIWAFNKQDERTNMMSVQPFQAKAIPFFKMNAGADIDASSHSAVTYPVLRFFEAKRDFTHHNALTQIQLGRIEKRSDYLPSARSHVDRAELLRVWLYSRSLARIQLAADRGVKWHEVVDDDLAFATQCVNAVLPAIQAIRFDTIEQSIVVFFGESFAKATPHRWDGISDGQKTVIALILDIAKTMIGVNPQLRERATSHTPALILIDELETHLHPRWQRLLAKKLPDVFSCAQFVVTSHSPQVIGEMKENQVLVLRTGSERVESVARSYGLTANEVLTELMEADERNTEIRARLHAIEDLIDDDALEEATTKLAALKEDTGDIPDVLRLNQMLKFAQDTE